MEEERAYTKEDLLQMAILTLENLNVPGKYLLQIGRPVSNTLDYLHIIKQIFDAENQELGKMNPPNPNAPELTLVKEEPANDERETVPEAEEPGTP